MNSVDIVEQAQAAGVQLVRFLYCDHSGVTRGKVIHVSHLASKLHEGLGLTRAQMAMNLLEDLVYVEGMEPVGEIRLVPDAETFSVLPWTPSSASLICDQLDHNHLNWGSCPRSFLKEVVAKAADVGIRVEATFENEFYLAREQNGTFVPPFGREPVYSSIGLDFSAQIMHDIVQALGSQGIVVEQAINEYGAGQQEISIHHAPAVKAADNQIKLRDTARGVALQHGLLASFAPKPYPDEIGSGCHVHFSLWDQQSGHNLLYDPQDPRRLSQTGRYFIAGILEHLPALVALTCPSYNSYRRLQPKAWSSAYTAWGFDNREAAVRIVSPFWGREEQSYHIELKTVDSSANPYIALAGLIAAGLDGVKRQLDPGAPCEHDPSLLSDAEREQNHIRRLPTTMASALDNLERSQLFMETMGDLLSRSYLAVRRSEEKAFSAQDTDFEIRHHFYKF
ncbi:MAG TPA: glutamine synthetase family protein [Ktedonobacteraceae bacterium]|jgi:glutamine synthetase|nr:glutamine synthetase family protein [Ktedonobacteraceae bacterium]